jgi:hypothetical protein
MQNAGLGKPSVQGWGEAIPSHLCALATTDKDVPPQPANATSHFDHSLSDEDDLETPQYLPVRQDLKQIAVLICPQRDGLADLQRPGVFPQAG